MLFPAFLSLIAPAYADDQQGQHDCAKLRSAVLQVVGDWATDMLFASRDMDRNGWFDPNIAQAAFKDVQIAVMCFDHAYEAVPKTRTACRALAMQFGVEVGSYIEEVMAIADVQRGAQRADSPIGQHGSAWHDLPRRWAP